MRSKLLCCATCGRGFRVSPSQDRRYCSRPCYEITIPTHGHTRVGKISPTYRTWIGLRGRCCDQTNPGFRHYGGRGIGVCAAWETFENFLADMGERPDGTSLDRIDNDGDYCPDNCRWATASEQCRNTSRNVFVSYRGRRVLLIDLAETFGLKRQTLANRIDRGWPENRWAQTPSRSIQVRS